MGNTEITLSKWNATAWKHKRCPTCRRELKLGMEVVVHRVGDMRRQHGARREHAYYCKQCWEKKYVDSDDQGLDQIEMTILQLVDGRWIPEIVRGKLLPQG